MKKILYLLVIACIMYITRQLIIIGFNLDIDYFLHFIIYFTAGHIGKELADFLISILKSFSMPLGPGNDLDTSSNSSTSSTNNVNDSVPTNSTSNNNNNNNTTNNSNNTTNNSSSTNNPSPINIPVGTQSNINIPTGSPSEPSTDTDWSDGEPASPRTLIAISAEVVNEVGSNNPLHRVHDPTNVTDGGYTGGGGMNPDSDSESNHSSDSALDTRGVATIQPFATNLANYIEQYKRDPNAVYSMAGYPRMDERSLNWYVGYLNSNFPSHVGSYRLNPTSSRIINALRDSA
jgi:hypothetical protein